MQIDAPQKSVHAENMDLSFQEYHQFQVFLSHSCGIILGDNKQYLVKNRLMNLLQEFDFKSFGELLRVLDDTSTLARRLKIRVIDAMTTNETFWFRDDMQFVELKENVLPNLIKKKGASIRIWSAACSSGQEAYSISICVEEVQRRNTLVAGRNVQLIGTDISETVLDEARTAVYSEMALSRGLDQATRARYFQQTHEGYKLTANVAQRVRFQQFNLLKPFSVLGRFDVIFCRNVLIYFSEQVKKDILTRMAGSLEPDGLIFLSSTESMPASLAEFELVRGAQARYFKKKSP